MNETTDNFPSETVDFLDQLLHCSAMGTHLLFSTPTIRAAFADPPAAALAPLEELAPHLQPVMATLLGLPDLEERRAFIDSLESSLRDLLIVVYFGFLDHYSASAGDRPAPLH
jgi:hypothetical protein